MNTSVLKNLALLAGIFIAINGQGQTVSTPIVGFSKITVPAGGRLVAPVFVKSPVYTGSASIASGVATLGSSVSGNLGPSSFTDRPNFPRYYLKVTSGTYSGLVLDIDSNTTSTVSMTGVPSGLTGSVGVQIIPHYTLGDFAANAQDQGMSAYADAVTFYDSGNAKRAYYYTGSGFIADDYSTPADNVVIYPGSGILLNAVSSCTVTMSGRVNTTPTIVPLYSGESIVAPIDPSGVSKVATINLASSLSPYVDAASSVLVDGSLATSAFYSDGSQMLDQDYNPIDSTTSPSVVIGNGFIVNAVADSQWVQPPVINP